MVKKIKNDKKNKKPEESNNNKENKEEKNIIKKEKQKNETILLKNLKEKRELAKNKKQKEKQTIKTNKKLENISPEEEEEEIENDTKINKEEIDESKEINEDDDDMDNLEEIEEESNEKEDDEEMEENEEEDDDEENNNDDNKDKNEEEDEAEDKSEQKNLKLLKNSISEHYYTFQYPKDLYTLLYTSLIFKWIDTTKILILCDSPKEGYKIDIFLRQFRFNTIYLDKEMPINTNNHFYTQYLKNTYQICIINLEYSEKSKNFAKEILDNTKIPITIIYFDCFSKSLLEYHSFHPNTREIYHFISNKDNFLDAYENLDENINFNEFVFDKEQMEHLRYRAEDMLNGVRKSDIKKEKMRKINIELLHSKKMQKFFKENPKERENIIRNIEENTIKNYSPSVSFLPSYLIHSENNVIADAIKKEYKDNTKKK